jgi:hypothetical protein
VFLPRFGEIWKGFLVLQTFLDIDDRDALVPYRNVDYLLLQMAFYYQSVSLPFRAIQVLSFQSNRDRRNFL